jgi:putative colanic acid biosynthesis acetyltransferase WcaF
MQPPVASPPPIFQRCDRCARYPYRLREYLGRALWEIVQATLIRYSPRRASGWRNAWLRLFGATMHPGSAIRPTTRIWHPWLLEVGAHTTLADGVTVYNLGPVRIGEHSVISQDVYLCAGTHDYRQPHLPLIRSPIVIEGGVWVCARAFIGPGVTLGRNAIVGACSVVMRDVRTGMIVAGNPAREVRPRFEAELDVADETDAGSHRGERQAA